MIGKITEIFESVQGEGLYFGEKQLFVRFYGCGLSCKFCDTKPESFFEYQPQELVDELNLYQDNYHSVSFTGGEPLAQKDFLSEVLRLSRKSGFKNYLETSGTMPEELEEVIEYVDVVAMDLKLPSSTGLGSYWQEHRKFLEVGSSKDIFVKAVISETTNEGDLIEAVNLIKEANCAPVLVLQPDSGDRYPFLKKKLEDFKQICLNCGITTCVIPQMHKIMGAR